MSSIGHFPAEDNDDDVGTYIGNALSQDYFFIYII